MPNFIISNSNIKAIYYGSTMVYLIDGFSAGTTLEAVTNYKCTSIYGVPTMFIEYLNEYERDKQNMMYLHQELVQLQDLQHKKHQLQMFQDLRIFQIVMDKLRQVLLHRFF